MGGRERKEGREEVEEGQREEGEREEGKGGGRVGKVERWPGGRDGRKEGKRGTEERERKGWERRRR